MMRAAPFRVLFPLLALLGLSCFEDDTGMEPLLWYTTCGDPACQEYTPSYHTNPVCTTQVEGESCSPQGDGCDLQAVCNTELICARADPKAGEYGCPISLRAAKTGIHYLEGQQSADLRDALMHMKLATWRYRTEPADGPEHVGFIIDDQPLGSPAVLPSGERVDLYGYTSMAVATLQVQQAELDAQQEKVAALEARLAAMEARLAAAGACPKD